MTVLTETMGMGLIMTAAHCDMELTATRKGVISSVTFVGVYVQYMGKTNDFHSIVFLFARNSFLIANLGFSGGHSRPTSCYCRHNAGCQSVHVNL